MGITRKGTGVVKKYAALPSGAQEQIVPKWRSRAPDESAPHIFVAHFDVNFV